MHNLIAKTIRFLQLQKPYKIVIKPKLKGGARAEYYAMMRKGKLVSHLIRINMSGMEYDLRDLDTLIVHEFIHAWQEENGLTEIHGPGFQQLARELGQVLGLENIYLKGVDV